MTGNQIISLLLVFGILCSCAHAPRCGNPDGAKTIYEGPRSCTVRIRQVVIAKDLKIPDTLKNPELATLELGWRDPVVKDGQIIMGHFVMSPSKIQEDSSQVLQRVTP